eukprot:SAG22_NODE_2000_length_3173_cov_2.355563_4_plen_56_part_00
MVAVEPFLHLELAKPVAAAAAAAAAKAEAEAKAATAWVSTYSYYTLPKARDAVNS